MEWWGGGGVHVKWSVGSVDSGDGGLGCNRW